MYESCLSVCMKAGSKNNVCFPVCKTVCIILAQRTLHASRGFTRLLARGTKTATASFAFNLNHYLSIVQLAGQKWKAHRKMLTPSFHFKILEQFTGVFNRNGDILTHRLSSHVDGPQFDITSYITMCTLDVVCGKSLSCRMYEIWRTLLYTSRALGCITELYVTH